MRVLTFILLTLLSSSCFATMHVKWQQDKIIDVPVVVGKETRVTFPEVSLIWNEPANGKLFARSFIDRTLFITPKIAFEKRVTFRGKDSNRIYILNFISVEDSASVNVTAELVIHLNEANPTGDAQRADVSVPNIMKSASLVDMVQFASQSIYSEIIEPNPGIRKVVVQTSSVPGFYQSGVLQATPLASWVSGTTYVTAVKMTNQTSVKVKFEPCRVKGDFISAVSQHLFVKPKQNKKSGSTVVYLTSSKPFAQAASKRITKCRTR